MAKRKFTAPKGMRDIMPDEAALFRRVEETFRETCRLFGYREIRTPHLEATDLFCRTVGETTDIVEKEMYTLTTKGGDELALRPENTAGVVRAYLEHGMHRSAPLQKFFYWGEMFRHEAKQKKRYREFTQAGVECFGSASVNADIEVIVLAVEFFRSLGLEDMRVDISTFGCTQCRGPFRAALLTYFKDRKAKLCADCRRRLDTNVFRLLDCKEEGCRAISQQAPRIGPYLDGDCQNHYNNVRDGLDVLNHYEPDCVPYNQNARLVRGLDYYNRTVFEIFPGSSSGRQDALGAGGRYDALAETLGGPTVPAVGFALGVDRIALELERARVHHDEASGIDVYVVGKEGEWEHRLQWVAMKLRRAKPSLACLTDVTGKTDLRPQMKSAAKSGARVAVLMTVEGKGTDVQFRFLLRDMVSGEQWPVDPDNLIEEVHKALAAREKEQKQ